jgi:hypothetical protein
MKFLSSLFSTFFLLGILTNCKTTTDPDQTTPFVGRWTATTNTTSNTATTISVTKGTTVWYIERIANDKVKIKATLNNAINDTNISIGKSTPLTLAADFTLLDVRISNDRLNINTYPATNTVTVLTGSGTVTGGKLIIALSVTAQGASQASNINYEFTR